MSSAEVIFSKIARVEIERLPPSKCVSIEAFDDDNNLVGEIHFFPRHKGGKATAPNITANCHVARTKE